MKQEMIWATGRRKTSIAQVRLTPDGAGKVTVNGKPAEEYFAGHERHRQEALSPIAKAAKDESKNFDAWVKVEGGGLTGQAQAVRHGLARALVKADEKFKKPMRKEGWLTRDPRMVERKKPGQPKARKRFQYSKR